MQVSSKRPIPSRPSWRTSSMWLMRAMPFAIALVVLWSSARVSDNPVVAQTGPVVVDPNLGVRSVVAGLTTPTSMAFLAANEFLVVEKATGQVKHVLDGAVIGTVLDLAVNFASERGLLGIALHPEFTTDPTKQFVYLYWTCTAPAPAEGVPPQDDCPDQPEPDGVDSNQVGAVPLLGNRVDRFIWNGSSLAFDTNLIKLRAFQFDASNGVARGNHDGGVIRFGPDGKLYIIVGDLGRRGQLQNLINGPAGAGQPDDQFGGPAPDDAHLSGVILRLDDDGSTPDDNPFVDVDLDLEDDAVEAQAEANIRKIFAYGVRNSFGMAFDPLSGNLWDQQNADDSFDELNRVEAGANLGWVQVMGPIARVAEFKAIETSEAFFGLQQVRWDPSNIASSPQEALSRLFMLPGARYVDPQFSWKYAVAPAAIGFLNGSGLGPQYVGDLFVGAATGNLAGGYLFHFNLTGNRRRIGVDDPRLEDRVADNTAKYDPTESETLQFGSGFGAVTDIQTSSSGTLYVVSLSQGTVYEIFRR